MKKVALAILISMFCVIGRSQDTISGKIIDSTGAGIEFATVGLMNSDSLVLQTVFSNNKGEFSFSDVDTGNYLLKIIMVGFSDSYLKFNFKGGQHLIPPVILKNAGINLNEVNVVSLKKLVEFKNGNITVNVEDSPLATGNSAWDLLIRLPGVTIDENKEISIQGRSGVKILIDGRVQQMSGKQLENLLRSLNASNIGKIEVLKNPPLKYDAQGTGGLINIKTKKVKMYGLSGNIDYTFSQGFYGNNYGNLALNYKSKKFIFFSNFNAESEIYYNDHRFYNKIKTDTSVTVLDQRMDHFSGAKAYSGNIGLDWLLNPNNTIGIKMESQGGKGFDKSVGNNYISNNSLGFTRLRYDSYVANTWDYFNFNLNAEHVFDTLGAKLVFSADYSPNFDIYPGTCDNWFLDGEGNQTLPQYHFRNDHVLKNNILSSKLDYVKTTKNQLTIEAGIKGTSSDVLSRYNFQNKNNNTGEFTIDPLFTNVFYYKEQLMAGYFNLTKEWNNFSVQAGCRGENTHIGANNESKTISYTRNYFNFFPAVNLSYTKNEKHQWQLNYNRRIGRPGYDQFSPFIYRNSLFQLYQGNPNLLPEYYNTFELSHRFSERLSNSVSYSLIDHFSLDYTIQVDSSKATIATIGNLSNAEQLGYNVFYKSNIKKWWNITFNGTASYLRCSGVLLGQNYKAEGYSYQASLTNELLIRSAKIEINARYIGPRFNGIWFNQPRWGVYLAAKRSFLKEKLNVVIGIDDIFFTMIGRNQINYQNQEWYVTSTNDTRRLKISLSYNFGKIKVQQREVNSNTEEKERLGK